MENQNDAEGTMFFRKAAASNGSIVSLLIKGRCIYGSDLNANSVNLVDAEDAKILLHSYSVAGRVLVSELLNLRDLENHFLIISASLGKTDNGSEDLTAPNTRSFSSAC
ncbi:MAG: hypothetical protein LBP81_03630 [Treponema sp.]|jgi:hypothetical protein|nr:hypothetical protein [Treponema sp.]